MTSYVLLEKIQVQNANCIAGFTYGFPTVTSFLGLTHHLSRQLKDIIGVSFNGCAIFCHDYHIDSYQDYYTKFIQSRNPPSTLKGKSSEAKSPAPIIEEGKMDMTVSLLLRCDDILSSRDDDKDDYTKAIKNTLFKSRLAGGTIKNVKNVHLLSRHHQLWREVKAKLLPCFVLLDKTELLKEHCDNNPNQPLLDSWTDFFAIKHKAHQDEEGNISWQKVIPPNKKGWIVPLMIGYKAISQLYEPNEVKNVRDSTYPFRFVEAVHGLGEWRSLHRFYQHDDIDALFWRYDIDDIWYLCKQISMVEKSDDFDLSDYSDYEL